MNVSKTTHIASGDIFQTGTGHTSDQELHNSLVEFLQITSDEDLSGSGLSTKDVAICLGIVIEWCDANIRCNNCYWTGTEDELIYINDDDERFQGCPDCNTDEFLMDLD